MLDSSQIPHQGIHHSANQSATGGIPVQRCFERLVAKGKEQTGSTIPMPVFARRPSTMDPVSPGMVDQQRLHISELHFVKFSTLSTCSCWKMRSKTQVSSCSDFPSEAMLRIKEVEMVDSVDDLKSSRSIEGKDFPNFEMLDAKIASSLNKTIQNSYFKKNFSLEEQKVQKEDRFLRGRLYMIYDYIRVIGAQDTVLDYADLFSLTLRDDNVQEFDTRWAESVRSGNSHVTSQPMSFPPHPIPEGMLRHSFVSPRRKEGPPSIWDTRGFSGNFFADPHASSSAPYPQELNPWGTTIEEPLHVSTAEKSERPKQNQDLRCQSGPSAKDSVIFSGGDSSKNYGADQQRLQISDLHFDKFPTPATFACWKIWFKTEVCTCSQFPTEAMLWIKEVELVDSVDELRSS